MPKATITAYVDNALTVAAERYAETLSKALGVTVNRSTIINAALADFLTRRGAIPPESAPAVLPNTTK